MKKTLKSIVLLGALCGGSLHAVFQFRSPLSLEDRGYMHWLLAPADKAWWYDEMPSEKKHTAWNIHMWGAGYVRTADKEFYNSEHPNKITRDTATLSQLFFGQQVFVGENVFAGGTFAGAPSTTQVIVNGANPFLSFARIMPKFDYNEQGCNMGIDFARYVGKNDRWHVGGRVNVPFKIIEIEQDSNLTIEETLDDVFVTRVIAIDTDGAALADSTEYAMRFDFLSTLVFQTNTVPSGNTTTQPIIRYNNSGTPTATIQIAGQALTGTSSGQADDIPVAYATKSCDGTVPVPPFRRSPNQVTTALGPDGQGVDNSVLFFQTGVDYAGNLRNDRAAQSTIFVTPRSISNPGNPDDGALTPASAAVLTAVQDLVDADLAISEPVSTFFLNNGINLTAYERIVGVGDLAAEIYGGIGHYNDWFVDGIFGVQFPTGKRQKSSNDIYYVTTGNNGHVEIKIELDGGWQPRPWFAFEIRPAFSHACKRKEKRAAPFKGATVINIGPEIETKVSWNYFVLRTDFSFFHPHNPDLGFTLGYELFAKGHDKVSLDDCQATATDLLGQTNQPLDVENYEHHTNSFSNKLRGQIFHRWSYFEIFGGGTQMVSGRNIMKETEGHIGLAIYF